MDSTLTMTEPRVKLWKEAHVGAVWGWSLTREVRHAGVQSGGVAGADAAPIAQSHCYSATDDPETT